METQKSSVEVKKQESGAVPATERMKTGNVYLPNVDIIEDREAIVLHADMPGVDEKDVIVTLENDVLTIEGKVHPARWEDHRLAYAEYGVGDYFRSFIINENIDRDKIQATLKDGILTIVLPKAEAAKPKKITVNAA